jgi:hypothetical protein
MKPPLSKVPRAAMEAICAGLCDGEDRLGYEENDWRELDPQMFKDAALRHITAAVCEGQKVDPDSGIDHLAKALANLAMVVTIEKYVFQRNVAE